MFVRDATCGFQSSCITGEGVQPMQITLNDAVKYFAKRATNECEMRLCEMQAIVNKINNVC
jgi:hypothetical protein